MVLNPQKIPAEFWELLPWAAEWGISDDGFRTDKVESASPSQREALIRCLDQVDADALWHWLSGPESESQSPSNEYVAITALTMAVDWAIVLAQNEAGPAT